MKRIGLVVCAAVAMMSCQPQKPVEVYQPAAENALRAPAVPLITIDPFTSAWSFADRLNDDVVRHWTGHAHPLVGSLRVDGQTYRFMGGNDFYFSHDSVALAAPFGEKAVQRKVTVMPTQTFYTFDCGGVQLDLIFTAPMLLDDLDAMSSPYNYMTYQLQATDGKRHDVQLFLSATPQLAVNTADQPVTYRQVSGERLEYLVTGTEEQAILLRKGDGVRIDWGYFYLAMPKKAGLQGVIAPAEEARAAFLKEGKLPEKPASVSSDLRAENAVLAYVDPIGKVGEQPVAGHALIGYDDIQSIQYFHENRPAYWTHEGQISIQQAFEQGDATYAETMRRCGTFDSTMMAEAVAAGGQKYAELCALAYRQAIAAHKLVTDPEGNLLFFSKECYSNGSIGTVDVTYPSAPLFLHYNPELLKGMMNPIFRFSESGLWKKPFPAHDMGTYPIANGQTYNGDMPVEESGNMLVLTTAIAVVEGNADYAAKHWEVLTTWADYLLKEGLDPANQLCTDDFAGHFAHNTNLSIKAIMGIAGYGRLAQMLGKEEIAQQYTEAARSMAEKWVKMAADGDHYRLTFDKPGTWSQKYNLVWDRLLDLNIFPAEVAATEMAYYKTIQNRYGLPLDNREDYTKNDWILWSACLTGNQADFEALMSPVWDFANETPSRIPLSDWYFTTSGKHRGFQARSVVGGFFLRMLEKQLGK